MLGVQPSIISGALLLHNTTNGELLHILLYADISIGGVVIASFIISRILKKLL